MCVAVHTVEIIRGLARLLGERTVREVRDCVEGRRLCRGRGHGSQAGLSLELCLELVVLVHGQTGQGQRDYRLRLHLSRNGQREASRTAGQPGHPGLERLTSAVLWAICDQLVQLVCGGKDRLSDS